MRTINGIERVSRARLPIPNAPFVQWQAPETSKVTGLWRRASSAHGLAKPRARSL